MNTLIRRRAGLATVWLALALAATRMLASDTLRWQTNRVSADIKSGELTNSWVNPFARDSPAA